MERTRNIIYVKKSGRNFFKRNMVLEELNLKFDEKNTRSGFKQTSKM